MPGWMVVSRVEFENRRKKQILDRHMLSLALELSKLRCILNTPVGYAQHSGPQRMSLHWRQ